MIKHSQFMEIAAIVAVSSHCKRAKVGAVVVKNNRIVSTGYNGTCSGDDNNCEENNVSLPNVIHAENNALLFATTPDLTNAILYTTLQPCLHCAALIAQKGISTVYYKDDYRDDSSIKFLEKLGINVYKI